MIGKKPEASQARCVVVFGGIDPGGGAGLAADIRAGRERGILVAPIPAVLTVQSTSGLESVEDVDPRWLRRAAVKVFRDQRVGCMKTGAIGGNGRGILRLVRGDRPLEHVRRIPLVIDPVLLPTLATSTKRKRGTSATQKKLLSSQSSLVALLPYADLVTPNGPEAAQFAGFEVIDERSAVAAAQCFLTRGAAAVLLKGGHWGGRRAVSDVFIMNGGEPVFLRAKRMELPPLHGGGCTLASLIAAEIALRGYERGKIAASDWREILLIARSHHQKLLRASTDVGGRLQVLVNARLTRNERQARNRGSARK